jgi:hypothetical protein
MQTTGLINLSLAITCTLWSRWHTSWGPLSGDPYLYSLITMAYQLRPPITRQGVLLQYVLLPWQSPPPHLPTFNPNLGVVTTTNANPHAPSRTASGSTTGLHRRRSESESPTTSPSPPRTSSLRTAGRVLALPHAPSHGRVSDTSCVTLNLLVVRVDRGLKTCLVS